MTTETLGPADGARGSLTSRAPLTTLSPVSGIGTVFTTKSTPAVCRGKPGTRASEGPKGCITGGRDQRPVIGTHRLGGTAPADVSASQTRFWSGSQRRPTGLIRPPARGSAARGDQADY